jgi:hypothetical protein
MDKQEAKAEGSMEVLLADYKTVTDRVDALEKGRNYDEARDIRQQNQELYEKQSALQSEIVERERKSREMRDTWQFSGFGLLLIVVGCLLYRKTAWPGFALVITGFCILEYWASPSFFGGGALAEFHQLLVAKTVLTLTALVALHVLWRFRAGPNRPEQAAAT